MLATHDAPSARRDSDTYAIYHLDQEDLTLFGYPASISTHQNAVWDHCIGLYASDAERELLLDGGRGIFQSIPTNEYIPLKVYTWSALQTLEEIYSRMGASFGALAAGGIMVYHDDGSGMQERLLSLPLSGDGSIDKQEIERVFLLCNYGSCNIVLETDRHWQLHFEISNADNAVEIMAFCLRSSSSYLADLGYDAFVGPDGESAAILADSAGAR